MPVYTIKLDSGQTVKVRIDAAGSTRTATPGPQGQATPKTAPVSAPSWGSVAESSLKNALPSLGRTAENVGSALMHPLDTVEGIVRGASGGLDLAMKAAGLHPSQLYHSPEEYQKDVATAHQMMNHLKSRYGSEDAIKNTLATDPAGALLDASAILSPASGMFRKAGLPGASDVASAVTQAPVTAAIAGAKGLARKAGQGVAQVLGKTTGAGPEAVAESVAGKPGFVNQMRGDAGTEEDLANTAIQRLGQLKMDRNKKYESAQAALGNPELSTEPMVQNFVDRMNKEKVSVGDAKKLDFSKSSLGYDEGLPQIENAHKLFRSAWQKKNIGLQDAIVLKHQVGNLLDSTKPGSRAYAVLTDLTKGVDKVLKQHPEYRKMSLEYAAQSKYIDQLEKAFSLKSGKRQNIQTILTKMHTHSKRKNEFSRDLIDKLDPTGDLQAQMRGMMMKPAFRHGMSGTWIGPSIGLDVGGAGLAHSALPLAGLLPFLSTSPRLVGEAGNLAGKAGRAVKALSDRSNIPASALGALLNAEGNNENGN
jgi:hypothetical protein